MLYPIKVEDVELSLPVSDVTNLEGYMGFKGLVRLYGEPIGYIDMSIENGKVDGAVMRKNIIDKHFWTISNRLIQFKYTADNTNQTEWVNASPARYEGILPSITVVVCTRDRTADLQLCLESLSRLDYPDLDILVIDNAPETDATEKLIKSKFPFVRHVLEPRPGLDWARNRAVIEAKGDIIAYTDDDVIVDKSWAAAYGKLFSENPEVMASTGLVVPFEIETEAQALFEEYGGFGRGFKRKWSCVPKGNKMPWQLLGTGQFGTGANMAFRKEVFKNVGLFDPALDVGTVTNGGGDLEMYFRVLKEGFTLVYEPAAMVRHRHRREYEKLKTQLTNNGSLYSYFIAGGKKYPDTRKAFFKLGTFWMRYWNLRRLMVSFLSPGKFPRDLIWAETKGAFRGLSRYQKACKNAKMIESKFGPFPSLSFNVGNTSNSTGVKASGTGVRMLELTKPIEPLVDVYQYAFVKLYITYEGNPIADIQINNAGQSVSKSRLVEEITNALQFNVINVSKTYEDYQVYDKTKEVVSGRFLEVKNTQSLLTESNVLPLNTSVTILLSTYNRPDDLRNCLSCLTTQETERTYEIIVVDNCPSSGLTAPVLADFPEVHLVNEFRQGVAYARNAGIIASKGDIIITTDDDVTMPADWMEKLIVSFSRPEVMCITGNILPVELATRSQQLFEEYGGLGRGYYKREFNGSWFNSFKFRAVPVWHIGGTANSAFRASIFKNPEIGLMDESLGPGMPSGVGEDSYLFYKILKANFTIVYEPHAFVWHNHRRSMEALKKQIYNYSKGHISHHITTYMRDGDRRGLLQIFFRLPQAHLYRIKMRLKGKSSYPIRLLLVEMKGNLIGPFALYRSLRMVKKLGRSSFDSIPKTKIIEQTSVLV